MKEDLLQQIEQMMPTFSKSQKLIASYILNHYEKAAPTDMNAIPQQLVANVSGQSELERPQLISSSRTPIATGTPSCCSFA